ncbi:MAG: Bd3614 family nucleic acid deaminase [Acidobacteriota bacterium]
MLSLGQHNAICHYLAALGYRDCAYWVNELPTGVEVWVARQTLLEGGKIWPPMVNLIQGLLKRSNDHQFSRGEFCVPQGVAFTPACQGMISFFTKIEFRGDIPLQRNATLTPVEEADGLHDPRRRQVFLRNARVALDDRPLTVQEVAQAHDDDRGADACRGAGPTPQTANLDDAFQASHLHRLYMMVAYDRLAHSDTGSGHRIGAILVEPNGRTRLITRNLKRVNKTFHAEVNLVQTIARLDPGLLDRRCYLYTTLKPCLMCAGMIAAYAPRWVVCYAQNDPGSHAQGIAVPAQGDVFQLGDRGTKPLKLFGARPHEPRDPVPPGTPDPWREMDIQEDVARRREAEAWQRTAATGTIAATLDQHRQHLPNPFDRQRRIPLTMALDHRTTPALFQQAGNALGRKTAKYGDSRLRQQYKAPPTPQQVQRRQAIHEIVRHLEWLAPDATSQ